MVRGGYVYFMSNRSNNVLYVGVTASLSIRGFQHKTNHFPNSFTSKYKCHKLVFYECFSSIEEAIAREKNIKNWKREWKSSLINELNPDWNDLSDEIEGY